MKLTILGSGCMVPTKDRNHASFLLTHGQDGILFDCGEGTQRQFKKANLKPNKITKIILSHWHGDHVLGIPGLLDTLSNSEYSKTLEIYGPRGTEKKIKILNSLFDSHRNINVIVKDILEDGVFVNETNFKIEAYELNHSIKCFGFRFIEKDKLKIDLLKTKKYNIPMGPGFGKLQKGNNIKINGTLIKSSDVTTKIKGKIISYVADTKYCNNCLKIAKNSDILICESTYLSSENEKAEEYKHLTSKIASEIAKTSKVKKLILTHFSQRYKNNSDFLNDAKSFKNVICAEDFMEIKF